MPHVIIFKVNSLGMSVQIGQQFVANNCLLSYVYLICNQIPKYHYIPHAILVQLASYKYISEIHSYDSSFQVNKHGIAKYYIDSKMPSIQSHSTYFSKFSWRGMPPDLPSISMLCMLIVLHTITHNHSCAMKLHWIMCPDHRLLSMTLFNTNVEISGYRP